MYFPWPGDCGQGKSPFAFGERPYIPTPTVDLAPTMVGNCPEGCVLFSALRLESHPSGGFPVCLIVVSRSGKKNIRSVLSVPLW